MVMLVVPGKVDRESNGPPPDRGTGHARMVAGICRGTDASKLVALDLFEKSIYSS